MDKVFFPSESPTDIQRRVIYLMALVTLAFGVILMRVWYLQVIKGDYYAEQSENNRMRVVHLQPQRGLVYDRAGRVLVNNVPGFNLYLVPEDIPDRADVLAKLERYIGLDPAEVRRRLNSPKYAVPYMPVKIKEDMSMEEVAILEAHRLELPGVRIEAEPQRSYPNGEVAAHLLGYVGEVSPAQLKDLGGEGVLPGMIVGQYGVEKSYDRFIRGAPGQKTIEIDALGHEMKVVRTHEPAAGDDLYLTIDLELQRVAEQALAGQAGSIVALDPNNGDVLALVSHPAFDPNRLSRGVNAADWDAIISHPKRPLTNRAIQGQYPPGSTFKIVVSAASLETKTVTPASSVFCRGFMPFGRRIYNDWKRGGHGTVDLHAAMVQSCDVYFYDVGRRVGVDPIADYAVQFGLGRPTGIELLSEKGGLIPTTSWKSRVLGEPWFPGETLSVAIGQGYVTATPLQMANLVGIVATSGERFQPHLVKAVRSRDTGRLFDFPPVRLENPSIGRDTYSILRKALRGVVADPHGTGGAARVNTVAIAGKTGTSQVVGARPGVPTKSLPKEFQDHAWFVAFAPVDAPRLAVAVLVENGGHGGEAAAPKARQIIEAYLNRDRSTVGQQL